MSFGLWDFTSFTSFTAFQLRKHSKTRVFSNMALQEQPKRLKNACVFEQSDCGRPSAAKIRKHTKTRVFSCQYVWATFGRVQKTHKNMCFQPHLDPWGFQFLETRKYVCFRTWRLKSVQKHTKTCVFSRNVTLGAQAQRKFENTQKHVFSVVGTFGQRLGDLSLSLQNTHKHVLSTTLA